MQLKPIFETSGDLKYKEILLDLRERFGTGNFKYLSPSAVSDSYSIESGYARKTYRGELKEGILLTELELSMICDNGYNYFGGTSVINSDGTFRVVIWID